MVTQLAQLGISLIYRNGAPAGTKGCLQSRKATFDVF